ncbi:MAG: hypothetical protein JW869_06150 [Candidatus Omnitrophica bacterium]|nr:hypothetical protein [Candidatus Omnitrophota bacterium]
MNNKRAQALVEFAMFGAVLLVVFAFMLRYGMGTIQKQSAMMHGQRKAFVRASSSNSGRSGNINPGWSYENSNPPLPSNTWRNVTYVVIEDKPVFSPSGVLPVVERTPIGMSFDAVRSIDMYGIMSYGSTADLPRLEYEINGRRYSFTTAAFVEYQEHDQMRKKEDIPDWDGQGPSWQWVTVSSAGEGEAVDVDGDGYEEYVMEKSGTTLKCIDYQEGEVNPNKRIGDVGRERGGLEPDIDKESLVNASTLTRQEDASSIITTNYIDAHDIIKRKIRTRAGTYNDGVYDVVDDLATQGTETWETEF